MEETRVVGDDERSVEGVGEGVVEPEVDEIKARLARRGVLPRRRATAEPAAPTSLTRAAGSIEEVRARLAARGLLRESTGEVAVPEPLAAPAVAPPTHDPALAEVLDEEVPEPEYPPIGAGGSAIAATCPACSSVSYVPAAETGFRCRTCDRAWRWAICQSCDRLSLTVARQESWRCACGHFTRSWWRAPAPMQHAQVIVARRRSDAAREAEAMARARARRRRVLAVVAGVALVALGATGVLALASRPPGAGEVSSRVCARFATLKADILNGTASRAEVDAEIAAIADDARRAPAPIATAAANLARAGTPGTATFLVAQTELSDACDRL